jgi:hypothetical protein
MKYKEKTGTKINKAKITKLKAKKKKKKKVVLSC